MRKNNLLSTIENSILEDYLSANQITYPVQEEKVEEIVKKLGDCSLAENLKKVLVYRKALDIAVSNSLYLLRSISTLKDGDEFILSFSEGIEFLEQFKNISLPYLVEISSTENEGELKIKIIRSQNSENVRIQDI